MALPKPQIYFSSSHYPHAPDRDSPCNPCLAGVQRLVDVQPAPIHWLWPPYIPLEHVSLLYGDGGMRKSWLTMALAAAVTTGGKVSPYDLEACEKRAVLLCTTEDDPAATLQPRASGLGADLSRLLVRHGAMSLSGADGPLLEETVAQNDVGLVILDPIVGLMADTDIHRSHKVRPLLASLDRMAKRQRCAVLLVHHISKTAGTKARHRALGSVDFMNACRSALLVGLDPQAAEKDSVLVHTKHNLSPTGPGPSLAFTTAEGYRFQWRGQSGLAADDVLQESEAASPLKAAETWLREWLQDGPQPVKDILEAAQQAGIGEGTVRRARERVCQRPIKSGKHWVWQLATADNE